MQRPQPETVTLKDILITEELSQRSRSVSEGKSLRPSNLQAENQALHTLARQLVNQPEKMLQSLVDIALNLCSASSAGVSLLETTPHGEEIFRWNVLAGTLAQYVGGTTPRYFSPCGVCLDRGTPQLFSHIERYFTDFQATNTPFVEGLVLPLIADHHALGTIWIVSHDEQRHFDSEDVRVMTSLADLTAAALLVNQRQTQELLAANVRLEAEVVERQVVEDSLHNSQERYRVALEAAELATWDWHVLTNRVIWNEQHYRLLGLEPVQGEEFADSFTRFVHPEDLPQVRERLERAIAENGVYQADFRIVRADTGEICWISSYGRVIETQDGQATRMSGVMSDSTNRMRAQAQLREAQRRLELSVTGANLGVWTYNIVTDEFWADDRAKLMHGHATHEVHTFAEAGANIHPEDRDRAQAAIAQAIQDGSKLQIEYRVIWSDGSVHSIASYAEFIPTGDRDEGMFYGAAQDISDRKRVETQLRESEERSRALIENLPGGAVFVVDRDLRYLLAEGEALSTAGFKPENFVGRTIFEVLTPELAAYYEVLYRQGLAGESFEHEHNAHDRSYISRGTPLRSLDGEVYAVLAVSYDISDRKRAEEKLRASERKLQSAIAVAQLSPYEWNPLTGKLKWDTRLKAMWGLSADAQINDEAHNAGIHPKDREYVERQEAKALDPNGDGIFEAEFRTIGIEDKIERWVSARGQTFFDEQGRPVHYVGAAQDVTDRKQAEADRIQLIREQANRLEAERMSQMKDEFLAMISHELQSPLVAILGWTRLLRANPPAPKMLMKHLETIERNAMLQAKLIQDLLDISRISAGKLRLNLQPLELESVIESAIAAVSTAAIIKNISVQYPVTDRASTAVAVLGDCDRLQQVFCNFLTNAIKFTPEAGSITVELSTIKAKKPNLVSMAEVRFVDSGIGISKDFLPHVFDRFHQAEKSGSAGGLGLGLAIARHLVELHDGTIHAESAGVGQGATFVVRLPIMQQ